MGNYIRSTSSPPFLVDNLLTSLPCGQPPHLPPLWTTSSPPFLADNLLTSLPCGEPPHLPPLWTTSSPPSLVDNLLTSPPCGQPPHLPPLWTTSSPPSLVDTLVIEGPNTAKDNLIWKHMLSGRLQIEFVCLQFSYLFLHVHRVPTS